MVLLREAEFSLFVGGGPEVVLEEIFVVNGEVVKFVGCVEFVVGSILGIFCGLGILYGLWPFLWVLPLGTRMRGPYTEMSGDSLNHRKSELRGKSVLMDLRGDYTGVPLFMTKIYIRNFGIISENHWLTEKHGHEQLCG